MEFVNNFANYCREIKDYWTMGARGNNTSSLGFEVIPGENIVEMVTELQKQTEHMGVTMSATVPLQSIKRMGQGNKTAQDLYSFVKTMEECMVDVFGLQFGNSSSVLIKVSGVSYLLYVSNPISRLHFVLYSEYGSHNLSAIKVNKGVSVTVIYEWLQGVICKELEGIVQCSRCHEEMKVEDIAGSFYAARYCKACWDSKYKAVEATENYN